MSHGTTGFEVVIRGEARKVLIKRVESGLYDIFVDGVRRAILRRKRKARWSTVSVRPPCSEYGGDSREKSVTSFCYGEL